VPKEKAGILVDEQFGASVLRDAAAQGYTIACPPRRAGKRSSTSVRRGLREAYRSFHPTFCKVLVRYNPEGDQALNQRQAERLKRLSDYLHNKGQSQFIFELLVPAEKSQFDQLNRDKKTYDLELRPKLMVQAIQQLQDAGVEPDVWKVEGLDRTEDCEAIVAAARRSAVTKLVASFWPR